MISAVTKYLFALLMICSASLPAHAISDAELIRGFNLTVFNTEFSGNAFGNAYVKKFGGEVRFRIHNRSKIDRTAKVTGFIRRINTEIRGLEARLAHGANKANFHVYIVDRVDYVKTVQDILFNGRKRSIPGKCIVRSRFTRGGILRSDAIIVSDTGDALFNRCMVEEILQGLGPLNDHSSLEKSVFNDTSKHTGFTTYDRALLNVLYDRRLRNGTSVSKANKILPVIVRDVKARLSN